jgi:hypothetical protein
MTHVRAVFEKNATKLVTQSILNSHIHASNEYLQKFEGQQVNEFWGGADTYLTEEQYVEVKHVDLHFFICLQCYYCFLSINKYVHASIPWLVDHSEAYQTLCKLWASEEFIKKSKRVRQCRGSDRGHTYGLDGYIRLSKHMVRKIITKMHAKYIYNTNLYS